MNWKDYVLFLNWLKEAEVNDTLCIQTGNDGKYILKLIKHEKEEEELIGDGYWNSSKKVKKTA